MRKITYANMRDSSLNGTTARVSDEEAARLVQSGQARYETADTVASQTATTAELAPTTSGTESADDTATGADTAADEAPASGRGRGTKP
ncbi:hypothetical protein [Rhodococcus sp. UNC363MFTsu5.1]|uniref:hypothetical protein n=1 Tax=Rhodococcus sp. UNC363MFTsu5.1 TaxID=1449069 RepID=UPI0004869760|nr:hypothetical protein [Rhodococcus sp. UNC363MFTsu5.1]